MLSPFARRRPSLRYLLIAAALFMLAVFGLFTLVTFLGGLYEASGLTADEFDRAAATGSFVALACLAAVLVLVVVGVVKVVRIRAANRRDHHLSLTLRDELTKLALSPDDVMYGELPETTTVVPTAVLEVERHFDQQLTAHIGGWLDHHFRAFAVGAQVGPVGYTHVNVTELWSSLRANVTGALRADLMSDALFMVLSVDRPGGSDTVRVVAPSAAATAQWLGGATMAVGRLFGPGTHCQLVTAAATPSIVERFRPADVSYAADRLRALARDGVTLPPLRVDGVLIGPNAVLAQRLRIGDGRWLHLFPAGFPARLAAVVAAVGQPTASAAVASVPFRAG